jgi:hypothetical protein
MKQFVYLSLSFPNTVASLLYPRWGIGEERQDYLKGEVGDGRLTTIALSEQNFLPIKFYFRLLP